MPRSSAAAPKFQINRQRASELSVILTDQSLDFVLSLSSRAYVLEKGEMNFSGAAAELRGNDKRRQSSDAAA